MKIDFKCDLNYTVEISQSMKIDFKFDLNYIVEISFLMPWGI